MCNKRNEWRVGMRSGNSFLTVSGGGFSMFTEYHVYVYENVSAFIMLHQKMYEHFGHWIYLPLLSTTRQTISIHKVYLSHYGYKFARCGYDVHFYLIPNVMKIKWTIKSNKNLYSLYAHGFFCSQQKSFFAGIFLLLPVFSLLLFVVSFLHLRIFFS